MTANTSASRKQKGRSHQQYIVRRLLETFEGLTERDVVSVPMGVNSEDVRLSAEGFRRFPYAVEAKNVEKLNIWAALKQAETGRQGVPLLVFKRNRTDVYCALKFEDFLTLIKTLDELRTK